MTTSRTIRAFPNLLTLIPQPLFPLLNFMLRRVEHRLSAWYIYKCRPSQKAHLEASFRDTKANQSAVRCTAGFNHKMAEQKHQLCDDRYVRHAGYEIVVLLDISIRRRAHLYSPATRLLKWLSLLDKAIHFMPLVFTVQINATSKTN